VQGTEAGPTRLTLARHPLPTTRGYVLEAPRQKARWSAQLLAGVKMPPDIERAFPARQAACSPSNCKVRRASAAAPEQGRPLNTQRRLLPEARRITASAKTPSVLFAQCGAQPAAQLLARSACGSARQIAWFPVRQPRHSSEISPKPRVGTGSTIAT